jgi:hypothetical protein
MTIASVAISRRRGDAVKSPSSSTASCGCDAELCTAAARRRPAAAILEEHRGRPIGGVDREGELAEL